MSPQQKAAVEAGNFVTKLNENILFPLIALLSAVAFLIFIYGSALYIFNGGNEEMRSNGKKHITYGIIGLVIMISAFTLLSIAANSFGLGKQLDCIDDPSATGCDFKVK